MAAFNFNSIGQVVPKVNTNFRKINTVIPSPGSEEIIKRLSKVESRSMHGQIPLVWDKAEDFSVYDQNGNKWIDFTSTIFVTNVGHSNSCIREAIQNSLNNSMLACYAYPNEGRATYLEKLVRFAGPNFDKAFLLSAGTESTEAAMKLMKMHGRKIGKRKNLVLAISGNWHGRTMGAQVLSSNSNQREWISNANTETVHIPFPYEDQLVHSPENFLIKSLEDLKKSGVDFEDDICGVMLETFQGWGAYFYPKKYVQVLRNLCTKHNILLAFDEMQSGFARTGLNFGYEHYEVKADLICCGKGMGGGLPLSGVIGTAAIMDLPEIGNMSSTHSGNPLLCAVGNAVIEEIENFQLVNKAKELGDILHEELNNLKLAYPTHIKRINGKGMIAAIIFDDRYRNFDLVCKVSEITEKCFQKGLLVVHTGRESIKIGPPLTIKKEALLEGISVLDEAIREVLC